MRSFAEIKPSRNGENTLSFTDVGKACQSREFLMCQISTLMLFAKIKFSRKFPKLQYHDFFFRIANFIRKHMRNVKLYREAGSLCLFE